MALVCLPPTRRLRPCRSMQASGKRSIRAAFWRLFFLATIVLWPTAMARVAACTGSSARSLGPEAVNQPSCAVRASTQQHYPEQKRKKIDRNRQQAKQDGCADRQFRADDGSETLDQNRLARA